MTHGRRLAAATAGLGVLAVIGAALLATAQAPGDGSTLSRTAAGWLVARRYLEAKGTDVRLIDRDPASTPLESGVLALVFPWQSGFGDAAAALERHLHAGGSVVIAYSARPGALETRVAAAAGLDWVDARPEPPLHPLEWRAYAAEEWTLATPASPAASRARIAAPRTIPRPPAGADVWLVGPEARPLAFAYPRARGRVVVLPADALANGRIREPGNADLLERLRQELPGSWSFDEYHHGLVAPAAAAASSGSRTLTLYLAQIAFLYVLVALAVVRRFGPAWREGTRPGGSAASFLLGLGALHDRLGHHAEAAAVLRARVTELDGRLTLPARPVATGAEFLELAREVGAAQSGGGRA